MYVFYLFIFFHFDFKDAIKYTAILSKFLHFLWKPCLTGVAFWDTLSRHPSHPGRGHGSLTCHMTQFERSDWLRSEKFHDRMVVIDLVTWRGYHMSDTLFFRFLQLASYDLWVYLIHIIFCNGIIYWKWLEITIKSVWNDPEYGL